MKYKVTCNVTETKVYLVDADNETHAFELGLERLVSDEKPDYYEECDSDISVTEVEKE